MKFVNMKVIILLFSLAACCYCLELEEKGSETVVQESRAKKKKNSLRLWGLLALFVLSKMAVFKAVSFMMLMSFFQKLFSLIGVFLGFYMNKMNLPSTTYGPPAEYNTVGYSYGPPDTEKITAAGQAYGLPNIDDISGSFNNWLFKHQ